MQINKEQDTHRLKIRNKKKENLAATFIEQLCDTPQLCWEFLNLNYSQTISIIDDFWFFFHHDILIYIRINNI